MSVAFFLYVGSTTKSSFEKRLISTLEWFIKLVFPPRVGCADQHVSGMAFLPEECWLKAFLSCLKKKLQVGESSCDYTHGVLKKVHIAQNVPSFWKERDA